MENTPANTMANDSQEKSRERLLKLQYMEELERAWRLSDVDQLRMRKSLALSTAHIIKTSNYPTFNSKYQGTRMHLKRCEEGERARRVADEDEARARRVNAMKMADAVNTDAATIKARFVKRQPTKPKRDFFSEVTDRFRKIPHDIPSISEIVDAATSVKDTIVKKVEDIANGLSRLSITRALEEQERARRIAEDPSSSAIGNARRTAVLIKGLQQPVFLSHSRGTNNYMKRVEERERNRRLANKYEAEVHKRGARRVVGILNQLGWPFIRSAKNSKPNFSQLEEEERARRIADSHMPRYNATKVAGLIKDALKPSDPRFLNDYTRRLEENERKRREKTDHFYAIPNARKHARLIAIAAHPFYVAPEYHLPISKSSEVHDWEYLHRVEEEERARRILNDEMLHARRHARKVAKMVKSQSFHYQGVVNKKLLRHGPHERDLLINQDTRLMEEEERKARMSDKFQQLHAMTLAGALSRIIKQRNPYSQSSARSPQPTTSLPLELSPAVQLTTVEPAVISVGSLPVSMHYPQSILGDECAPIDCAPSTSHPQPVAPLQPQHLVQPTHLPTQQPTQQPILLPKGQLSAKRTYVDSPVPPHANLFNTLQSSDFSTLPNPSTFATQPITQTVSVPQETYTPPSSLPATASVPFTNPNPTFTLLPSQIARPKSGTPTLPRSSFGKTRELDNPTPQTFTTQPPSSTYNPKLVESVQKLYSTELAAAERERERALRITKAHSGRLSTFWAQRHQHKASKHAANAERHQEYLNRAGFGTSTPGMSAR